MLTDFLIFFHWHILPEIYNKVVTIIPPHLNCVAALPCEI